MKTDEIVAVLHGPKPETMRGILDWENALAELMNRVVFVDEDGNVVEGK